jgi:diketogulonate reductase-like aldo/keto reductase
LDALRGLQELVGQGKITALGLTNFDTERLRIITDAGIRVVVNQVRLLLSP